MFWRSAVAAVLSLSAMAVQAGPSKMSPEFRSVLEGKVRKGAYAVVTQKGVPTTSIYGIDGQQTDAYYSVDVKGGAWQTSQGLFDVNQVEVDTLNLGEVMEVAGVSIKAGDNRVDLRMVSVETHRVRRGDGRQAREPVSTNFKFFFPMPLQSRDDTAAAMEYIGSYLSLFPNEDEARAHAAQVTAGAGAPAAPAKTAQAEIQQGMTPLEVLNALGKPTQELTFGSQSKWTYPQVTVVFENGRVKEVRF